MNVTAFQKLKSLMYIGLSEAFRKHSNVHVKTGSDILLNSQCPHLMVRRGAVCHTPLLKMEPLVVYNA